MKAKQIQNLENLQPDAANANKGTPRGRALLEKSLRTYGAGRSILADKHGSVIAGNKTLEVAADIGLPIRVIETDGTELVVVQRNDLDLGTDRAARELAYADNRVAQVDLSWDAVQLQEDMNAGLDLEGFFFPAELDAILADLPKLDTDGLDRVAPDNETARPGLFLHVGDLKIPVSQDEYDALSDRLDAYREECGTFYGFVGRLLDV